jgi:hypothetical protein
MAGSSVPRYALDVIRSWPDRAREAAYQVIRVHRSPDELEPGSLCWRGIGPWKRVVVRAHDGNEDPDDAVEAVIDAVVPAERHRDVVAVAAEFRVRMEDDGELSVRGRDLPSNVVTLNVLHSLVEGALSVEEAREQRSRHLADLRDGRPPADIQTLRLANDAPCGEPRPVGARAASDVRPPGTNMP